MSALASDRQGLGLVASEEATGKTAEEAADGVVDGVKAEGDASAAKEIGDFGGEADKQDVAVFADDGQDAVDDGAEVGNEITNCGCIANDLTNGIAEGDPAGEEVIDVLVDLDEEPLAIGASNSQSTVDLRAEVLDEVAGTMTLLIIAGGGSRCRRDSRRAGSSACGGHGVGPGLSCSGSGSSSDSTGSSACGSHGVGPGPSASVCVGVGLSRLRPGGRARRVGRASDGADLSRSRDGDRDGLDFASTIIAGNIAEADRAGHGAGGPG